jgi:hypothetical protein
MSDIQEEMKKQYKRAEENDNRLNEETVAVLVKPKKYIEMLEQANNTYGVYPPKVDKKNEYVTEVRTMYNLPVIISKDIDENIKFVNKEELEQIQILEQKRYEEFMRNYVSDIEFINGE